MHYFAPLPRIDLASVLPYDDFTDLLSESADGSLVQQGKSQFIGGLRV